MTVVNVLAHVELPDFDSGVAWYEGLFGRAPDRRPMDGSVEWQLNEHGGIQGYAGSAGPASVIIAVDDTDAVAAEMTASGLQPEVATVPSGQFRVATIQDPAGNTIMFTQTLNSD